MARETLTREQIVAAAIELLDADGIEALSMRRLGQQLGSAATSMYWHVGSKENLVVLAGDHAWGEVELPDLERLGWRAAASALAHNAYDMLVRHHWLVSAASTHLVYGPGMARFQEHNYAIYEAAGFTGADLDWAYNTMFNFLFGAAHGEGQKAVMQARLAKRDDGEAVFAEHLHRAEETAGQFPHLAARIRAQRDSDPDASTPGSFDYGVDTILDGLEVRLARSGS